MTEETKEKVNLSTESPTKGVAIYSGTKLVDAEKAIILSELSIRKNNRTHTAKALGIGIRTLQRKLKKYGVPAA